MAQAMNPAMTLDGADVNPRAAAVPLDPHMPDDKAMLRAAADLTRALNAPKPAIYWTDLIVSAVAVINQVGTLVAHLWENVGERVSVTAQYLDTVNVPPPALLPVLWAPVGLRYHALHHLLPGVPYHNLGEAHRRLTATLAPESPYHKASYKGLTGLVWRLGRSTMVSR